MERVTMSEKDIESPRSETVSQKELVKLIALKSRRSELQTQLFMDAMEESVIDFLRSVRDGDGNTIRIRLFNGCDLTAEMLPDTYKTDNFTGKTFLRKGYIKPKAKLSRRFVEKINKDIKIKPLPVAEQGKKRWTLHDDDESDEES